MYNKIYLDSKALLLITNRREADHTLRWLQSMPTAHSICSGSILSNIDCGIAFGSTHDINDNGLTADNHSRLTSEYEPACAYLNDRRIEDAIEIFEHVVAVRKETLDEKDHYRLESEHALARAYLDDRRIKDAIEILGRIVALESEILAHDDPRRLLSLDLLTEAYGRM